MEDVILTMKGIDKTFPGVHALDHVDFDADGADSDYRGDRRHFQPPPQDMTQAEKGVTYGNNGK